MASGRTGRRRRPAAARARRGAGGARRAARAAAARPGALVAAGPSAERVEGDEDDRHLGPDRGRRRLAPEPGLERDERQDGAVLQARISPSRMPSQARVARGLDDLRELAARRRGGRARRAGPSVPCLWSCARIPSYLSSTQTSGPEAPDDLGGVLGRRGEHELERVEQGHARRRRGGRRGPATASRPMSPVSIPAHLTSSSGRSNAFAMAASSSPSRSPIRSSPPSTLTMYFAVSGSERASSVAQDRGLAGRAGGRLDRRERGGHLGERRRRSRRRLVPGAGQDVGHGEAQVRVPVVGLAERRPVDARRAPRRPSRWPTSRGRPRAGPPPGTAGR